MSSQVRVPRRGFLKLTGIAASAVILGACSPRTTLEAEAPVMPSPPLPTLTPVPTATSMPAPTVVPTVVEEGSFRMGSTDGLPDEQPVHTVASPGPSTWVRVK
jgi:formylglycine-generating enzyme required for sulfatase activity